MPTRKDDKAPLLELATRSLDEQPLAIGAVARSVIRMTADSEVSIRELARAISSDPGLSGKIIKTANSAFYAGPSVVTSIPGAISKLGIIATRSAAITASVQALYRGGGHEGLEHALWRHSLAAAVAAKIVMQQAGSPLAEEAFLCALLHDIAKLILLQRFPDKYKPLLRRTMENNEMSLEIELTAMGFTHADLGAMILERWAFGPTSIRAVRFHHDPNRAGAATDEDKIRRDAVLLSYAICMANAIAKHLEKSARSASGTDLPNCPANAYFGFTDGQIRQILEETSFRVGDELQVFGQADTPMFSTQYRTRLPSHIR
jgi:putative nucleotidyltransferase with HDIG domain